MYHSDQKKHKVLRRYLESGNLADVCRRFKVPYETGKQWKRATWWEEEIKRLREETDTKLASKIDDVVEGAIEQIKERVSTGEKILDSKTGQVINVPVKTRDLTQAVKTLSDRQDILIGRQKQEAVSNTTIHEKLKLLASQFEKFAGKQKLPEIFEGEYTDALYDPRGETRLQEGVSGLLIQAESKEEQGTAECSQERDDGSR